MKDDNILEAAAVTFDSALLNALINPVTPVSPSVVNAELKEVIPLVSRPTIPICHTDKPVCLGDHSGQHVVSIPLMLL